jgi:predicted RNase H-like HicB family nuclease
MLDPHPQTDPVVIEITGQSPLREKMLNALTPTLSRSTGRGGKSAKAIALIEIINDPQQGGFTARIPEIPAYGEGETEEQAIADLRNAVKGYIETFGLEDAESRVLSPGIRVVDWHLKDLR